jgi:biotin synthase
VPQKRRTFADLAADIRFFAGRDIDMIGMGPYITARGSAMHDRGMLETEPLLQLSLSMIAETRLVLRDVNIAATTQLYDGKPCIDEARAECRSCLEQRVVSTVRRVGWNNWGNSRRYTGAASRPRRLRGPGAIPRGLSRATYTGDSSSKWG